MKKIFYLIISAGAGLIFSLLYLFGVFNWQENFLEDTLFYPKNISKEIVIVAIDDESIQKIGQWPWPRAVFAQAFQNLEKNPPLAVAVDAVFSEVSAQGEADDTIFSMALDSASFKVILATEGQGVELKESPSVYGFLSPLNKFAVQPQIGIGHANVIKDGDGVVRKIPLTLTDNVGHSVDSLALKTIKMVFGDNFVKSVEPVERVVFAGAAGTIRAVPFWRIYENDADLSGKIVFMGATAADLHDYYNVPFDRHLEMSGVEIQANIGNMFLNNYRLRDLPWFYGALWIFLAGFLPGVFFAVFRRLSDSILLSVLLGASYLFIIVMLSENGILANILHLTLSWIISLICLIIARYFLADRDKKQLKNIFCRYVSAEVVEKILENPKNINLGGEEKEVTVFFSDIRGFTTLSEKTRPVELVSLLNRYFTLMTGSVLNYGGVLDKYIGDAIMAFWGAPIENHNQADDALNAALEMIANLKEFNEKQIKDGLPPINIGIGIFTGTALVGNMGSDLRMNYTVTGDTVNVAARLEGLNKQFGTKIIFGENTKNKLKGKYKIKFLGSESVKGREAPVNIYTLEDV